jgi:hypothetical protein
MLVHTVFFWLKKNSRAGERERLIQGCHQLLGKIPTVQHLWAGAPASTPARDVIDATYDVGLTVALEDMKAHDIYQEHPLHKEFIAKHKEYWDRVRIYDFSAPGA